MKLNRLLWLAIRILAIVPTAFDGIRPSFRLEHSAWKNLLLRHLCPVGSCWVFDTAAIAITTSLALVSGPI
jgi:hypothetical protein